jgi:hypothetical protein
MKINAHFNIDAPGTWSGCTFVRLPNDASAFTIATCIDD